MENIQYSLSEKREHSRISLEIEVSIKSAQADSRILLGWIEDISHGGFKVRTDSPLNIKGFFHEGDTVWFETYEDFFKLKGKGEIRWTSAERGEAGIKFDELDDKSRGLLHEFLGMFAL